MTTGGMGEVWAVRLQFEFPKKSEMALQQTDWGLAHGTNVLLQVFNSRIDTIKGLFCKRDLYIYQYRRTDNPD